MNHFIWMGTVAAAAIVALGTTGCKGGPTCEEGAWKNTGDPAFCIKLPAGYKPQGAAQKYREGMAIRMVGPTYDGFQLIWEKGRDLDSSANTVARMESSDFPSVGKGDVPGRNGKWFRYRRKGQANDFSEVFVKGKDYLYTCEIQNTKPEIAEQMINACKTIAGP
jgi:hypothetical protein